MSESREQEIERKIEARSQKMLSYLTNENKTEDQLKKQFYFLASTHEKNPFMNENDLMQFRQSIRNIQLQNVGLIFLTAATSFGIYKLSGGFTPNEKKPWLRRIRHASVIALPSLIIPLIFNVTYQGESQLNIINLAHKYRSTIIDPQFNQKYVQNEAQKYRQQLLRK